MLTLTWDTLETLLMALLAAGWGALAWAARGLHTRLVKLESGKAGAVEVQKVSEEVAQVAQDLEVVKRVLFLVAHKLNIPAEALNR